jgi:hypothetical protein
MSATTRYIIKYVYKAVSRQKNSIIEKLEEEFPDKRTADYISFYALRTWGQLQVPPRRRLSLAKKPPIHAHLPLTGSYVCDTNLSSQSPKAVL